MKTILAAALLLACGIAQAASFQATVNISTPTTLYHGHNCSVSRFVIEPMDNTQNDLEVNCGYTISDSPVSGAATNGKMKMRRVQMDNILLDRADCVMVDQTLIYPSMVIEMECGWTYPLLINGFDHQ